MVKKTVKLDSKEIEKLPNNKPVVYKIKTKTGANVYTGIAKRGRVKDRIEEHLAGKKDHVPGAKVEVEQLSSIKDAQKKEEKIISKVKPKYNKKGK